MEKTGESYATARRQVLDEAPSDRPRKSVAPWHFRGRIPATTALRIILNAAGVKDPITKKPLTEAMLFGIAGGVGAGVAQFYYGKEDFSSFFIAGRHMWHDDEGYLRAALARFNIKYKVLECFGGKSAEKHLRDLLKGGRPCVAWVDMAHLPHRAMPRMWSGGGYHVITVYSIDDSKGTALIGDLADDPIEIALGDLATARGRIKKFKNRVLRIDEQCDRPFDLGMRIRAGIKSCHAGLGGKPMKGYPTMFNLDAFANLAKRIFGSSDKDSWEKIFPPGKHLWTALTSMYLFIEHYHTGGGLCRPMLAEFFSEVAQVMKTEPLRDLSSRYADLGKRWTELANAALPETVPLMKQARALIARRAELTSIGSMEAVAELREVWTQLSELQKQAVARFPLSAGACDQLRLELQKRVNAIHLDEVTARDLLSKAA